MALEVYACTTSFSSLFFGILLPSRMCCSLHVLVETMLSVVAVRGSPNCFLRVSGPHLHALRSSLSVVLRLRLAVPNIHVDSAAMFLTSTLLVMQDVSVLPWYKLHPGHKD